ncbi:hypothetical protein [Bacteroides sp. 224]|uniref:hypothetical protein n=1 Tax=Bacteroides sp. 224 TaxID=2302936 RepID=UPI0013D6E766|nr:hypothetical protein [Bacteroides sp. 224]NDV65458.1 hypothetical protein [Bacteroides sp. 224]
MARLKEFTLMEGETILAEIEGDAYNDSPNPIVQLITAFLKVFWLILGIKLRTYIIATNLRIVQVDKKTIFWGMLPGDTCVITLNKASIQSVGYAMATSFFIFRKFYFLMANMSGLIRITYKGNEKQLIEACNQIDKIVCEVK